MEDPAVLKSSIAKMYIFWICLCFCWQLCPFHTTVGSLHPQQTQCQVCFAQNARSLEWTDNMSERVVKTNVVQATGDKFAFTRNRAKKLTI